MRIVENQIFTAADLSQATLDSRAMDCDCMFGYSVQCTFTGSAVGNLVVQGSNDPVQELPYAGHPPVVNWTDISTVALTAPGTIMINVSDVNYKWFRLHYDKTSGTGSLTANFHAKGF